MPTLGVKPDRPLERVTEHGDFGDILRDELQILNVSGAEPAIVFTGEVDFEFDARVPRALINDAVHRAYNRQVKASSARAVLQVADNGVFTGA